MGETAGAGAATYSRQVPSVTKPHPIAPTNTRSPAWWAGWRFDDHACPRLTAHAGHISGRREIDMPGAKRVIERVDPDGAHLHEHLAVLRFRTVHLDQRFSS